MTQLLLSWQQQATQPRELQRLRSVIAPLILEFCAVKGIGGEFFMSELAAYVSERAPTAPASTDRILRDMRARGDVNYSVQRRKSLYRLEPLKQKQAA